MANLQDYIPKLLEAVSHQEAGRFHEASTGFADILALEPDQPQALFFAGTLAHRDGRLTEAIGLLERAVAGRPDNTEVHFAYGNALWSAGQRDQARDEWEATLRLTRRHVGAMLNIARAQELAGDYEVAVMTCRGAVACQHDQAMPRAALASALRSAQLLDASLAAADSALAIDPAYAQAHHQRGTTLKALGRLEEAADALREAVRLNPADASSQLNLANTLFDLGDAAAAERHCRAAIAADPAMPEAHAALGYFLTQSARLHEAITACDTAIKLDANFAEAHWNMGIALLSSGNLPAGFEKYEWRKRHPLYASQFRSLPTPEWDGGPLEGKRLLILAEQGLGDAIMFVRYASLLAERGATVWYACDRRLIPLLRHADGVAAAIPNSRDLPPHDLWVDQMSLPYLCETTVETIPSPTPYLSAPSGRAEIWRTRLPARTGAKLRIGIAWAGNPLHSNDKNRSCPVGAFRSIIDLRFVEAVSLQVGANSREAAALGLDDLGPLLTDYADTAALIANLDMLVTVDTSVAHVAASMGKPTWIMLPHCPEWRWLHGRDDSPWYDSVRLFRQRTIGDWQGCTSAVIGALMRVRPAPAKRKAKSAPRDRVLNEELV